MFLVFSNAKKKTSFVPVKKACILSPVLTAAHLFAISINFFAIEFHITVDEIRCPIQN